jgi:hypothetical protein
MNDILCIHRYFSTILGIYDDEKSVIAAEWDSAVRHHSPLLEYGLLNID